MAKRSTFARVLTGAGDVLSALGREANSVLRDAHAAGVTPERVAFVIVAVGTVASVRAAAIAHPDPPPAPAALAQSCALLFEQIHRNPKAFCDVLEAYSRVKASRAANREPTQSAPGHSDVVCGHADRLTGRACTRGPTHLLRGIGHAFD